MSWGSERDHPEYKERLSRFLEGLAKLASDTGFMVIGCGGCGCCASRQCPALIAVPVGDKYAVTHDHESDLKLTRVP